MQVKNVVLCEGKHDVTLISVILDQYRINHDLIFHEELARSSQRTPENNKIKDFLGRRGQTQKFLIKDEDGFAKCIKNFTTLYEDKDNRYLIYIILDSPAFSFFKKESKERFQKDILNKQSENYYTTKDKMNHRVFLIPKSLEYQVKSITGENLDFSNSDKLKAMLIEFCRQCKQDKVNWFLELEKIILT